MNVLQYLIKVISTSKGGLAFLFTYPYYYVTIWAIICGFFQRIGIGGFIRLIFDDVLDYFKNKR